MQCASQAPPDLLEGDGLARPAVDVEEQVVLICELRGDQVDGDVECAGQLRVRAGGDIILTEAIHQAHELCVLLSCC